MEPVRAWSGHSMRAGSPHSGTWYGSRAHVCGRPRHTVFDAIVAQGRREAAAGEDLWAGQPEAPRGGDRQCHDTARLGLFRALDAFGHPANQGMVARSRWQKRRGPGPGARRAADDGHRHGDEDALAAVDLAAAQHDFWLDLACGRGALAATVSEARLGPRVAVQPA